MRAEGTPKDKDMAMVGNVQRESPNAVSRRADAVVVNRTRQTQQRRMCVCVPGCVRSGCAYVE